MNLLVFVQVLAAVTSAGNVELITLQRGALMPLNSSISVSLGQACCRRDSPCALRWCRPLRSQTTTTSLQRSKGVALRLPKAWKSEALLQHKSCCRRLPGIVQLCQHEGYDTGCGWCQGGNQPHRPLK